MIIDGMSDANLVRTTHGSTNPKPLGAWLLFRNRPVFAYVQCRIDHWEMLGYRTLEGMIALASAPDLPIVKAF